MSALKLLNSFFMNLSNLKKYYSQIAILFLNTIILFVLLNILASYWQHSLSQPNKNTKIFPNEQIISSVEYLKRLDDPDNLLYKVYPGHTAEEIKFIFSRQSALIDHPSLGTMILPGQYGEFHSGKEGIRYDDYVTPDNIDSLINGSVWLLGGSTLYGHCMAQSETISNYLNQLDPANTYLNFGVPGYYQNTEVEKLVLLLKKGYHPKKVLFMDGNNDLLANLHFNFHPAEAPHRMEMAFPLRNRKQEEKARTAQQFILQLPLIALLKKKRQLATLKADNWKKLNLPYEDLGDSTSIYLQHDNSFPKATRMLPCSAMPFYPEKILELYQMNQDFVGKLAAAYQFEYEFIFQPLGFLHPENPFIKDFTAYRNAYECFDLLETTQQVIRDRISTGALPHFRDFSLADDKCEDCYVDLVHYSGKFNRQLAEMILSDYK